MYNEYSNDNFYHNQFSGDNIVAVDEPKKTGILSKIKAPELNTETLILCAVIFFCIYDDFDTELLIIIGALFFLGI